MDYTNRIIVDTSTGVAAVDKLGNSLEATGQKMAALGSSVVKVAADGVRDLSRSMTEAAQAAKAMPAAVNQGMAGTAVGMKQLAQGVREARKEIDAMGAHAPRIFITTTEGASQAVGKMGASVRRARRDVDDFDKSTKRAGSGGSKNMTRGIIEATRAAQDFSAAGMLGISNNIIEIGSRFGKFGVIAGAVLTGVALSWDHVVKGFNNFFSRPVVAIFSKPFIEWGKVTGQIFGDIYKAGEKTLDLVLGAAPDTAPMTKPLKEVETGLRKVELALGDNAKAQEELTKAGKLDENQIKKLNNLRNEEIGLLEYKKKLMDEERIRKEYGDRASDEEVKSGEAFKAATKGEKGKKVFDAIRRQMSENDASRLIRLLELGQVGPETLQAVLGPGGSGVQDVIKDFQLRIKGTNLKDATKAQKATDLVMAGLAASPWLHGGGAGRRAAGDSPVQNWHAPSAPKSAPILDQSPFPTSDDNARAMGGVIVGGGGYGTVSGQMEILGSEHFPKKNAGGAEGQRAKEYYGMIDQLRNSQFNIDEADREALANAEATAMQVIQSDKSREGRQKALITYLRAINRSISNGEMHDDVLTREMSALTNGMRQKSPPLGPSF